MSSALNIALLRSAYSSRSQAINILLLRSKDREPSMLLPTDSHSQCGFSPVTGAADFFRTVSTAFQRLGRATSEFRSPVIICEVLFAQGRLAI